MASCDWRNRSRCSYCNGIGAGNQAPSGKKLLKQSYNLLVEHGVCDYQWDECWNDNCLPVILAFIFIAVWRWALFKMDPVFVALERSMIAFADLKGFELL
jgi:hypothetical protein